MISNNAESINNNAPVFSDRSLHNLWCNDFQYHTSQHIISYHNHSVINYSQWFLHCHQLVEYLNTQQDIRWLLYTNNSYLFLVAFIALSISQKQVILPPNFQPETIRDLDDQFDRSFTDNDIQQLIGNDTPLPENHQQKYLSLSDNQLTFFTSGSTGKPQPVVKQLRHLLKECVSLNQLWPNKQPSVFISTVSHQHIYGLLFRVLWPFVSKQAFVAERFEFPEQVTAAATDYENIIWISSPAHLSRIHDVLPYSTVKKSIQGIYSSGGPLRFDTSEQYHKTLNTSPVEILGSTETGGIAWRQQAPDNTQGEWLTFDDVSITIDEATQQLGVTSPFINMKNNEFLTNDLAKPVSQDRFILLGRSDRIVKIEEKRVSLSNMENVLLDSAFVSSVKTVAVIGKRTTIGCVICLSNQGKDIYKTGGKRQLVQQLKQVLSGHFENVVLPRKWRFVEHLPINEQGKTTQTALLSLFEE